MAEVRLKKLFLVGTNEQKDPILKRLAYFGAIDVKDASFLLETEESKVQMDIADSHKYKLVIDDLMDIIKALTPYATKKGMLTVKPTASEVFLDEVLAGQSATMEKGDEILKVIRERASIPPEISRLEGQVLTLMPWMESDLPIGNTGTDFVEVVYGALPVAVTTEEMMDKTANLDMCIVPFSEDTNGRYIMTYLFKGSSEECLEALRELGFSRLNLRGFSKTPIEEATDIKKKISSLKIRDEELVEVLKAKSQDITSYEVLFDAVSNRFAMEEVKNNLLKSESAFYLTGFIPDSLCDKLETALDKYSVAINFSNVGENDNPPVLLHNNKLVQPYEMITELYSLPASGTFDPNWIMAPFFFLFFGMMLADIAYGLIMIGVGLFVLKKLKPEGFLKKLFGLVWQGGVATMLCGFVYGSFFGDVIPVFSRTFLGKEADLKRLIDPINEPMTMLFICCGIGVFQIIVGMGVKAYTMIKRGDVMGAIFDIGLWYVSFAGIAMLALKMPFAVYVLCAGVIGLVLTQGRHKKGFFGKLASGVLSLYNVTGYLSDVLSYSRLMALGIASAVVSSVFNTMGSLAGNSILGLILFIVVFIVGHTMNIAINILGSYVHASRLQYVEFFSKFYESGGRAFKAFRVKGKYNSIV